MYPAEMGRKLQKVLVELGVEGSAMNSFIFRGAPDIVLKRTRAVDYTLGFNAGDARTASDESSNVTRKRPTLNLKERVVGAIHRRWVKLLHYIFC